ncbi:MAG: hypothetical protein Q7J98_14645 [Kiritimatiellia bacterium]|nr:hypothetical protein [Kiritimatiellia bacterium]
MSSDSGKGQPDKKILHLDEAERLPAVSNSSPAAEVVKQIIEQILANERRRARIEFVRISVFFLVFLFAILGTGIWFARQLLIQLREERQLTEQTWRMVATGGDRSLAVYSADKTAMLPDQTEVTIPPALNREELARLEQNIKNVSEFLRTSPQSASTSVRDMLQSQQNAIQALNARLNEAQTGLDAAPEKARPVGFIAAPLTDDLNLRMPIPSL